MVYRISGIVCDNQVVKFLKRLFSYKKQKVLITMNDRSMCGNLHDEIIKKRIIIQKYALLIKPSML